MRKYPLKLNDIFVHCPDKVIYEEKTYPTSWCVFMAVIAMGVIAYVVVTR